MHEGGVVDGVGQTPLEAYVSGLGREGVERTVREITYYIRERETVARSTLTLDSLYATLIQAARSTSETQAATTLVYRNTARLLLSCDGPMFLAAAEQMSPALVAMLFLRNASLLETASEETRRIARLAWAAMRHWVAMREAAKDFETIDEAVYQILWPFVGGLIGEASGKLAEKFLLATRDERVDQVLGATAAICLLGGVCSSVFSESLSARTLQELIAKAGMRTTQPEAASAAARRHVTRSPAS